jgi:hypothetical protein
MGDEFKLDQGDDEENNANLALDCSTHAATQGTRTGFLIWLSIEIHYRHNTLINDAIIPSLSGASETYPNRYRHCWRTAVIHRMCLSATPTGMCRWNEYTVRRTKSTQGKRP